MEERLVNENETTRGAIREKLLAAAEGMQSRFGREGVEISYARDIDHLYVTIGLPSVTLSIPAEEEIGIVLLYDPDSYELKGVEVPSFMERYAAFGSRRAAGDFLHLAADLVRDHGDTIYIPGDSETRRAEQALRQLASAV